jgi:hypothetical protein
MGVVDQMFNEPGYSYRQARNTHLRLLNHGFRVSTRRMHVEFPWAGFVPGQMYVDLMRRASGHRACNPRAVSGEEVAARAGARYAARGATSAGAEAAINRRGAEPNVTGSLAPRRPPPPKRLRYDPDEDHRFPALPMAEPGDDGEDD